MDEITAVLEEEQCVLLASRWSPSELVRVTFLAVQMAQALELNKEAGFWLTGSGAQMQETLAGHPDLIEPGLRVLNRELLVESGGIDLYAQNTQGRFVVELKCGRATQDTVSELGRYVASVQRVVGTGVVRGILAAPSITGSARWELEVGALSLSEKTTTQPSLF